MQRTLLRMTSSLQEGQTLVGRTGISYWLQKVIYERKRKETEYREVMHSVWLARYDLSDLQPLLLVALILTTHSSNNSSYVVKPVTPSHSDQAFRLQEDLSFSPFVRLPVDGNNANTALMTS